MEKFKKVVYIIGKVLLVILLFLLIIAVSCNIALTVQKNNGSQTPNIFGLAPISFNGDKLEPDFKDGDYLIIQKKDKYDLGDIVTFINAQGYDTLKIVDIKINEKNGAVLEYIVADSKGKSVRTLLQTSIYGKVVIRFPGFAPVVSFFQSLPGVSVLIFIIVFFLFLPNIIGYTRKK